MLFAPSPTVNRIHFAKLTNLSDAEKSQAQIRSDLEYVLNDLQ